MYAAVAILVGEERLEGADGLTALGWATFALPVLIGATLIAASFSRWAGPGRRIVGLLFVAAAVCCFVLPMYALFTSPRFDAVIGGGILMIASIPLAAAARMILVGSGSAARD